MNYPYVQATKRLQDFMEEIRKQPIPKNVDNDWFKDIGYGTRNDFRMAQVLEHIYLVDKNGKPTKNWKEYKEADDPSKILAPLIRKAYTKFFNNFPEPQEMKNRDLREFLKKYINAGKQVLYYTVRTFDVLAEMCDFSVLPKDQQPGPEKKPQPQQSPKGEEKSLTKEAIVLKGHSGTSVNINIEIQIGENTKPELIDRLFDNISQKLMKN